MTTAWPPLEKNLLRQFLLGTLDSLQVQAISDQLWHDETAQSAMHLCEQELIEDFVLGKLTGSEQILANAYVQTSRHSRAQLETQTRLAAVSQAIRATLAQSEPESTALKLLAIGKSAMQALAQQLTLPVFALAPAPALSFRDLGLAIPTLEVPLNQDRILLNLTVVDETPDQHLIARLYSIERQHQSAELASVELPFTPDRAFAVELDVSELEEDSYILKVFDADDAQAVPVERFVFTLLFEERDHSLKG